MDALDLGIGAMDSVNGFPRVRRVAKFYNTMMPFSLPDARVFPTNRLRKQLADRSTRTYATPDGETIRIA